MKVLILFLFLPFFSFCQQKEDIQLVVKMNGSVVDSAIVEIADQRLISDKLGIVNCNLIPGKYEVMVLKDDFIQLFEIRVTDTTNLIMLNIN